MNSKEIDYVFFGTPDFAVSVLKQLDAAGLPPSLVVTAPDKKRGRGQNKQPTPVKSWSQKQEVPVLTPDTIDEDFLQTIGDKSSDGQWPLFVVVAYGQILPAEMIYHPAHNTLNLHPSLLPRVRGAAPIRGAILNEDKTGVTVIELDDKMDHGPIVAQTDVETDQWPPYYNQIKPKLAKAGGRLLVETIPHWVAGSINTTAQNHDNATYIKKFSSEDGKIDFADSTDTNLRKIRAFTDWPKAHFYTDNNRRVIICEASLKNGKLNITKVRPAGGSIQSFEEFKQTHNF
jgi:methionyl-tRNA formyltransferase